MKKLAILSPLVILMASTSLAQDSCITRPSCADMGYTKTEADCTGKTTLKCPFDLTALFCPEGGNTDSEGIGCPWGEILENGACKKIENAIAFVLSVNGNNGGIELRLPKAYNSSINVQIDWGDGNVEISNSSVPSHIYSQPGEYQIVITGNTDGFYVYHLSNSYPIRILNLDLNSLTSMGSLNSGSAVFRDCSYVTGSIPSTLPSNLIVAEGLFKGCKNLEGTIPTLPDNLRYASYMFDGCSKLTGSISQLSSVEYAEYMFNDCSRLTGNIPPLSENLSSADKMFSGCIGLTGEVPQLPDGLYYAYRMFYNCGLRGYTPNLPSGLDFDSCAEGTLTPCTETFGHTDIENNGTWPAGAF